MRQEGQRQADHRASLADIAIAKERLRRLSHMSDASSDDDDSDDISVRDVAMKHTELQRFSIRPSSNEGSIIQSTEIMQDDLVDDQQTSSDRPSKLQQNIEKTKVLLMQPSHQKMATKRKRYGRESTVFDGSEFTLAPLKTSFPSSREEVDNKEAALKSSFSSSREGAVETTVRRPHQSTILDGSEFSMATIKSSFAIPKQKLETADVEKVPEEDL